MLQRIFIHLSLIILFAVTQFGVVSHEISHLSENSHQNQQDKNTNDSPCERCIGYNYTDANDSVRPFTFNLASLTNTFKASVRLSFISNTQFFLSARAPPKNSQT